MDDILPRYEALKTKFLNDKTICPENRELFKKFFKEEEVRLKRRNGLDKIDQGAGKTLYKYCIQLRCVNTWFKNKPWVSLTEKEIERVYNDLEDGKIKKQNGKRYEDRSAFYNKIMKSEPFELAGVAHHARKVIVTIKKQPDVKFIEFEKVEKLISYVRLPQHKLLFWLAFDVGENISSLLQLKKSNFTRQLNPTNNEPEYRVSLPKLILKRTRKERSEITNYPQTVGLLDEVLQDLKPEETLYKFGYAQAKKLMQRAATASKVLCIPNNDKPTWKDLRSSMACDILKKGYTIEEVNSRLGHKLSSSEIEKYVSFLALDRHKPKEKVQAFEVEQLRQEIEQIKQREKLMLKRYTDLHEVVEYYRRKNKI